MQQDLESLCLSGDVEACHILSSMNSSETLITFGAVLLAMLTVACISPYLVSMWRGY